MVNSGWYDFTWASELSFPALELTCFGALLGMGRVLGFEVREGLGFSRQRQNRPNPAIIRPNLRPKPKPQPAITQDAIGTYGAYSPS